MLHEAGLNGDVRKRAIAVVLVKVIGRFLPAREAGKAPAVDDEDVGPFVVVVVEDSRAPARRGEKKILRVTSPDDGGAGQAGLRREVRIMRQVAACGAG